MSDGRPITLDGNGPLYDQVYRALSKPILDGRWRVGTRLPAEEHLASELGLSRMTVNKAFQRLADNGLVQRRRRAGTVVATQPNEHALLTITEPAEDIAQAGGHYGYQLLERQRLRPNEQLADSLAMPAGEPLLHLKCLHCSNGAPAMLENRFISLVSVPEAAQTDFNEESPGPWLLKRVPWTEAKHTIRAVNAEGDVAELLNLAEHAACLIVERNTWRDGAAVTHVELIYPGNRHRLAATFSPSGPPERAD